MPSVDDRPKRLASEIVFAGRKATVRRDRLELPSGRETFWEIIETPGAVGILPFVDHNHIILLRQYRYAVSRKSTRFRRGRWKSMRNQGPARCGNWKKKQAIAPRGLFR